MTPHPVTETRDGVVYLLVPLPEVERCTDGRGGWILPDSKWWWGDDWSTSDLANQVDRVTEYGLAAAAVLHARQAERTAVDKWLPGICPACGRTGLFVADGGYVTCSNSGCPNPGAPYDALSRQAERTPTPEECPTPEAHSSPFWVCPNCSCRPVPAPEGPIPEWTVNADRAVIVLNSTVREWESDEDMSQVVFVRMAVETLLAAGLITPTPEETTVSETPVRDAVAAALRLRGYEHDEASSDAYWTRPDLGVRPMLACLEWELNKEHASAAETAALGEA